MTDFMPTKIEHHSWVILWAFGAKDTLRGVVVAVESGEKGGVFVCHERIAME
jgi:hypothetical protein